MKRSIIILASALIAISCSEQSQSSEEKNGVTAASEKSVDVPASEKETSVTIVFSSGTMKGTHVFTPEEGNYSSQINVGFDDNISNLNGSTLISEDGKHRLMISRQFKGGASLGEHVSKLNNGICGVFKIRSLDESNNYSIIRGDFIDCTTTNILASGAWEEGTVYNRRGVVAKFSDRAKIEVSQPSGTLKEETSKLTVTIRARESRLK